MSTRSEIMKRALADPAVRAKIGARSRAAWERNPARRAQQSARMKKFYRRPGIKAKMVLAKGKAAAKHRSHLDALVAEMYADYGSGMSLAAVGRKYGRTNSAVAGLFEVRGYALRRDGTNPNAVHLPNGCFAPAPPLTKKEIQALIDKATKIRIPDELRLEWRKWPLERRGDFIARIRARLKSPYDRPETPCSKGIEFFDYATPRVHAIMAEKNRGKGSRRFAMKIDLQSQGVIFRDQLWFWSHKVGYQRGPWDPKNGRPALHRVLYEEMHGIKLRPDQVVYFADGNRNNFSIDNLRLKSRDTLARENQAAGLTRKSRELTALLLKRSQRKGEEKNASDEAALKAVLE